jgi:hypothetical protein
VFTYFDTNEEDFAYTFFVVCVFIQSVEYNDLMILASVVRIPLWDIGASLSDETA